MNVDEKLLELDTEKPAKAYPHSALKEIQLRYSFACQFVVAKNVVEIGYGAGYGVVDLATRAKSYLGIDLLESNKLLAETRLIAADLLGRAKVIRGEATEIPVADSSADVLIAFAMIYYIDVPTFFSEVFRVVKPGGTFVFCQTNPSAMNFSPSRNTILYYTRSEIIRLLSEAGFSSKIYGAPEPVDFTARKYVIFQKFKEMVKSAVPFLYSHIRRRLVKYEVLPENISLNEADPMLKNLQLVTEKNEESVRVLFVVASKLTSGSLV